MIEIKPLHVVGQDDRGATYDYHLENREDYVLIQRAAGSISGNAYHLEKNKNTNPKTFILLSGEIELSYRHIEQQQHEVVHIQQPSMIMIQPYVTHAVRAVTDMVMLECNSIQDLQDNRIRKAVDLGAQDAK